jgi:hypothetical protein
MSFYEAFQTTPPTGLTQTDVSGLLLKLDTTKYRNDLGKYMADGKVEQSRLQSYELSQEKNRFADSQLSIYAFLNIVGVGLLIYLAAASR